MNKFLQKIHDRFIPSATPEPDEPEVIGTDLAPPAPTGSGPMPGKVDFRQIMRRIAHRPGMRGVRFMAFSRVHRKLGPDVKLRQKRMNFLYESARQGVEIAKARRVDYLKRRAARWRGVVEAKMPGMFMSALQEAGLPMPIDPREREGFKNAGEGEFK